MTKTVKAAAAKVEKATEAKVEAQVNETTNKLNEGTEVARNLFGAFTQSGKKAFAGVIEFDKALFGIAKNTVSGALNHGKATMSAKCINDVVDLQAAYAHSYIEDAAANSRELIDMARSKTQEAYAPVKEAIADLKGDKAAA